MNGLVYFVFHGMEWMALIFPSLSPTNRFYPLTVWEVGQPQKAFVNIWNHHDNREVRLNIIPNSKSNLLPPPTHSILTFVLFLPLFAYVSPSLSVWNSLHNMQQLTELDLSSNRISSLTNLHLNPSLEAVILDSNPIFALDERELRTCNCSLQ